MFKGKVNDYIAALDKARLFVEASGTTNGEVTGVTFNSKAVEPGFIFVCKGAHFKPEYLEEAISCGAVAYVSETAYPVSGAGAIIVKDIRAAMPVLSVTFYGNLSEKLKMLGITGTKGKTSTTYFLKSIMNSYMKSVGGKKVAFYSGIDNYDGVTQSESHNTTPENMDLFSVMNTAVESGVEYMVMEVSSQALKYRRVDKVDYEATCLLNIGTDHISPIEHPDMEDYKKSKLMIFDNCKIACVNLDCDFRDEIQTAAKKAPKVITFSQKDPEADVYGCNIEAGEAQVKFDVKVKNRAHGGPGQEAAGEECYTVELGVFSTINVENALAAIAMATAVDVPAENIQEGLAHVSVPGRLQVIRSRDDRRMAIVDYAHNKLSFEMLFSHLKEDLPDKDFIVVFGSSGMKAISRRKDLGEIAGQNARLCIITEDDPGEEPIEKICSEIAGYVESVGGKSESVYIRGDAIKRAFELADDNTIVIVTGKGPEKWIKRGTQFVEVPSDVEYVHKYINE